MEVIIYDGFDDNEYYQDNNNSSNNICCGKRLENIIKNRNNYICHFYNIRIIRILTPIPKLFKRDKNRDMMRIAIAEEMVKYMMEKRKVEIKDLIVEYSTTQVKNCISCLFK